jgi:hypothetical protein
MENLRFFEGEIKCYNLYVNQITNSLAKVWSNQIESFATFLFWTLNTIGFHYVNDHSGVLF